MKRNEMTSFLWRTDRCAFVKWVQAINAGYSTRYWH